MRAIFRFFVFVNICKFVLRKIKKIRSSTNAEIYQI